MFEQRNRLADAERALQAKATKTVFENKRIATEKIDAFLRRLGDLRRPTPQARDGRIFPSHYAPVMVNENGERVIKPMRYQCRPAGRPAFYDPKFPGTYNARRDNLEGFRKLLFGHSLGVSVINAFYENVSGALLQGRPKDANVVLEFKPIPPIDMFVACL